MWPLIGVVMCSESYSGRSCLPHPQRGGYVWSSPRPISTSQLNVSLRLRFWPINPVISRGPYPLKGVGHLILKQASRLDAFSGYPFRTWLTSHAPGGTTGTPEVRPSRSSRTRDSPSQVSNARGG